MAKVLHIKDNKKRYVLKVDNPEKIEINQGEYNSIYDKKGNQYKTSCINCKNKTCKNINKDKIRISKFHEIENFTQNDMCPCNAILEEEKCIKIDRNKCIGCGLCAINCPFGAIYIKEGKAGVSFNECILEETQNENEQMECINKFDSIKKGEGIIKESDIYINKLYRKIELLSQEEQNILIRNVLLTLGFNTTLSRKGSIYLRMDGFWQKGDKFGVVEIETGQDMLDVSRAILDDIAVSHARYGVNKDKEHPLAVLLSLPNKRTDFWQVIKDINKVVNIKINTITFGALLLLVWNNVEINHFDDFYLDMDNMSIRKQLEELLGRKINISQGYYGVLENQK